MTLPPTIREDEFAAILTQAVQDHTIHGIFFFSPLPPNLNEAHLRSLIPPAKDVHRRHYNIRLPADLREVLAFGMSHGDGGVGGQQQLGERLAHHHPCAGG